MERIVINMQNYLVSEAIQMTLEKGSAFHVDIAEEPSDVTRKCHTSSAAVLLMEVSGHPHWGFEERMKIFEEVKKNNPLCKVVLFVDENSDGQLACRVKCAKKNGSIDQFIYGSTSANFLVALLETL